MTPLAWRLLLLFGGLFVCFRGYSTFRFALGFTSFLVGAYGVVSHHALLPPEPAWLAPVLALVAGILAAVLVLAAYRIGVFLLGAASFILIALEFPAALPVEPSRRLLVLCLIGVAGGLLSRFVERAVVSAATALLGALMVVSAAVGTGNTSLPAIRTVGDLPADSLFLGAWVGLAVFGFLSQLRVGRPVPHRETPEARAKF